MAAGPGIRSGASDPDVPGASGEKMNDSAQITAMVPSTTRKTRITSITAATARLTKPARLPW